MILENTEKFGETERSERSLGLNGFILAAGLGTRMLELTETTPKPLLKFKGKYLIDYSLELMQKFEIQECVINVHYLSDQIIEHVDQWLADTQNPFIVRYSLEKELLGTAGGIRTGLPYFSSPDKPIVILNPDTLIMPDIQDFPTLFSGDSDESGKKLNFSYEYSANSDSIDTYLYLLPLEEDRSESWFEFSDINQKTEDSTNSIRSVNNAYRPIKMFPKGSDGTTGIGKSRYYYIGYSVINPSMIKDLEINKKAELGPLWKNSSDKGRLFGKIFKGSIIDMGTKSAYLGSLADQEKS
jgi:N-acetyl-alpha-D-muramate 1-phosphate uridylyltransferase